MLDFRAWIIAGVILLAAAGGYVIWMRRPQVAQTGRSLSAVVPHANSGKPATTSLHVDGCSDDFIVKPGELVEPKAVPGAAIEAFRQLYGPETKVEDGQAIWDQDAFTLSDFENGEGVGVSLKQGHVLETLDGIELGIDSFGTIYRKMARDRKVQLHERIAHGANDWKLVVTFYSSCGKKFRSEYTRTIEGSPEVDRLIELQVSGSGAPSSKRGLLRSDIFMNKIVSDYSLVPSNGRDEATDGTPSEHQ